MSDTLSIDGVVATEPRHTVTGEGLAITSFRLASAQRRFNKQSQSWETAETNWYTITAFRALALNAARSISKSDRVVVTGKLRIRAWENGEKSGTNVEIEAETLGHDLAWGTSTYSRSVSASGHAGAAHETAGPPADSFAPISVDAFAPAPSDDDAWADATAPLVAPA